MFWLQVHKLFNENEDRFYSCSAKLTEWKLMRELNQEKCLSQLLKQKQNTVYMS